MSKTIRIGSHDLCAVFEICLANKSEPPFSLVLDISNGAICREDLCAPEAVGSGRPAVAAGKQFIRIPGLDELSQRFKTSAEERNTAVRDKADESERALLDIMERDEAGYCTAMSWLKSLQPPCDIEIFEGTWDDQDCPSQFKYDCKKREWKAITE